MPLVVAAFVLAGTSSAQAEMTLYPQDPDARNLNAGPAGWIGSASSEGLCVPVVLCPAIDNSVPSSGGQHDSGYLNTSLGSLLGVGATSIGTFTGPEFTYNGVKGETPGSVQLDLVRRSDVEALLSVAGNSATFTVKLIDKSGGADLSAIGKTTLEGATSFTKFRSAKIDPSDLKLGHTYQIQISSRFESGAEVLPGGSVGYDNVTLEAIAKDGGNGDDGNSGNGGQDGQNGNDRVDLFGGVVNHHVKVKGKFVVAKLKCSRHAAKRKCKSKLNARLSRNGPKVTSTQKVRVKSGRTAKVKLRIRGKYRKDVRNANRLTIQRKTRVAGKVKTTYRAARVRG